MNKVSLNGVEIYPFDSEQSLLSFVNDNKGILVAINAEKILHATDQTRGIINRNIGYCDGAGAQMALNCVKNMQGFTLSVIGMDISRQTRNGKDL